MGLLALPVTKFWGFFLIDGVALNFPELSSCHVLVIKMNNLLYMNWSRTIVFWNKNKVGNFPCNLSRSFNATQVARKIAQCKTLQHFSYRNRCEKNKSVSSTLGNAATNFSTVAQCNRHSCNLCRNVQHHRPIKFNLSNFLQFMLL